MVGGNLESMVAEEKGSMMVTVEKGSMMVTEEKGSMMATEEKESESEGLKEDSTRVSALESNKVGSNQNIDLGGSKGSWIGAVQGQKVLKKYDVEVTMKDGIGSVIVPEEITKDVEPLWEDFIIGKFLEEAPHIAKVHAIVNKIWNLNDKTQRVEVFEVNSTMMKFRVPNLADRNMILRRGMWNLAGVPVVMAKWSPVTVKEKPAVQSIPMWVHIKNVPQKMFSWKGLSYLTSPVGSPVRLHPETAQCIKIDVAKIFVKVDLTKDLPKKMNFTIQGEEVLVEYSYPRLPTKCPNCEKWGHSAKSCPLVKEKEKEVEEGEIRKDDRGEEEEGKSKENQEILEEAKEAALALSPPRIMSQKEEESKTGSMEEGSISKQKKSNSDQEWLTVSPGKMSRTPSHTEMEAIQETILTKSRFSVLMDDQDELVEENEAQSEDENQDSIKEVEEIVPRRMLPRESKVNHRYFKDKAGQKTQDEDPSSLRKKKPRRQ